MNVAISARVSTHDKDQNPETQLRPLRQHLAGLKDVSVVGEFIDKAGAADDLGQVLVVRAGDETSARGRPANQRRRRAALQNMPNGAGDRSADNRLDGDAAAAEAAPAEAEDEQVVSVAEAARLLGRDHTRVYALMRSGDLADLPPFAPSTAGQTMGQSFLCS